MLSALFHFGLKASSQTLQAQENFNFRRNFLYQNVQDTEKLTNLKLPSSNFEYNLKAHLLKNKISNVTESNYKEVARNYCFSYSLKYENAILGSLKQADIKLGYRILCPQAVSVLAFGYSPEFFEKDLEFFIKNYFDRYYLQMGGNYLFNNFQANRNTADSQIKVSLFEFAGRFSSLFEQILVLFSLFMSFYVFVKQKE